MERVKYKARETVPGPFSLVVITLVPRFRGRQLSEVGCYSLFQKKKLWPTNDPWSCSLDELSAFIDGRDHFDYVRSWEVVEAPVSTAALERV